MKLLKKNASLKLPIRQIQAVLSDPKHRIKTMPKNENVLTEEEKHQNEEFAQIAQELAEEDDE